MSSSLSVLYNSQPRLYLNNFSQSACGCTMGTPGWMQKTLKIELQLLVYINLSINFENILSHTQAQLSCLLFSQVLLKARNCIEFFELTYYYHRWTRSKIPKGGAVSFPEGGCKFFESEGGYPPLNPKKIFRLRHLLFLTVPFYKIPCFE